MTDITLEQLNKWIEFLWSLSWRGLIVFAVVAYREAVISIIKGAVEVAVSWLKRK